MKFKGGDALKGSVGHQHAPGVGHVRGAHCFSSVAFSPDGKTLAAAADRIVKLWDTSTRRELTTLNGHTAYINSVAFSPDGKTLASAGADQTVRLWVAATKEEVAAALSKQ